METWTVQKLLDWTTDYFKNYNIEWPHLEAEILLAHALDIKRIQLYTNHERTVSQGELSRFKALILRRSKHEPIAYITNNQPFMSLDFFVDPAVLIPRPETEKLVEIAIEEAKQKDPSLLITDIGTGSGCIAVSLAKFLPETKVIAIDSAEKAIKIAQKNAEFHRVADRCQFALGNLFEPLKEKVDLIVSNPPYIPSADIKTLETDVKDFEPVAALDGGKDGLDYIKQIIDQSPDHLNPQGMLLVEIGFDQGSHVKNMAQENKRYTNIEIKKDLNGNDRVLKAQIN
jgi:release factor glutamine methyltransferase